MATKHTIGIIGTGTMGCGLAQIAAQAGFDVVFQNRRQSLENSGCNMGKVLIFLHYI